VGFLFLGRKFLGEVVVERNVPEKFDAKKKPGRKNGSERKKP
jgi:hypothetical protein